jgi:hypothetical protein
MNMPTLCTSSRNTGFQSPHILPVVHTVQHPFVPFALSKQQSGDIPASIHRLGPVNWHGPICTSIGLVQLVKRRTIRTNGFCAESSTGSIGTSD